MWEVVGFKRREKENKVYFDLYLQRVDPAVTGVACHVINYAANYIAYAPVLGDQIVFSMGVYNGRQYVQDIMKVG